jgi:predicted DNA binding CopG/RHH family protein
VIRYRKGLDIKTTDPAVLQELMDRVTARRTQAVSLRIPVSDIDAAKKIAAQMGLGYQTVLKEIISKALRNA